MRKALLRILARRWPLALANTPPGKYLSAAMREMGWAHRARQCGFVLVKPAPDRFAFARRDDESQRYPLYGDLGAFQVEGFLAEREAGN